MTNMTSREQGLCKASEQGETAWVRRARTDPDRVDVVQPCTQFSRSVPIVNYTCMKTCFVTVSLLGRWIVHMEKKCAIGLYLTPHSQIYSKRGQDLLYITEL